MKYKYKKNKALKKYFFCLFSFIALLFIVAMSNKKNVIVASNINSVKAIESSRIITPDKELEEVNDNEDNYIKIQKIEDINNNIGKKIEFDGIIKNYFQECEDCFKDLKCIKNINSIYYDDNLYGTVRIIAADQSIPCGSIIKITDYMDNKIYGIVLDTINNSNVFEINILNKKINNNLTDKESVNFKIERWGY